jgi:hypothetical protein
MAQKIINIIQHDVIQNRHRARFFCVFVYKIRFERDLKLQAHTYVILHASFICFQPVLLPPIALNHKKNFFHHFHFHNLCVLINFSFLINKIVVALYGETLEPSPPYLQRRGLSLMNMFRVKFIRAPWRIRYSFIH